MGEFVRVASTADVKPGQAVVVEAVVYAVDVSLPTAPACPLPITYTSLSEACDPTTINNQTVAEVEVLYLYLMLTG